MSDQLQLALAAVQPRLYTCCGAPAPALSERPPHFAHPHAQDCPNPNVGTYCDRYGRMIRRLHCGDDAMRSGVCPSGGRCPWRADVLDPHMGECCLSLRAIAVLPRTVV